jgi:hypothetical protein
VDHNSGYVAAAYLVVAVTLGGYCAWVAARLRSASRSERDDGV